MKQLFYLYLCTLMITSCGNKTESTKVSTPTSSTTDTSVNKPTVATPAAVATINWMDDFRKFRDAVYQKDKEAVAAYFSFPISKESAEVFWYLVEQPNKSSQPFTKAEFITYFDKIFTPTFVKGILKLKTEEIVAKGSFSGIDLSDAKNNTETISGSYDEASKEFSINHNFSGTSNNEVYESAQVWFFDVKGNSIKFNRFLMAG